MKTAADVMNRTFFHASPSDTIGVLLHEMAERGLGCVPVLDATGRPLGVATTGEIEPCYDIDELIEHLARPAICVDQNTPIDIAARELAQHPSCALILVDGGGIAVGAGLAFDRMGRELASPWARSLPSSCSGRWSAWRRVWRARRRVMSAGKAQTC